MFLRLAIIALGGDNASHYSPCTMYRQLVNSFLYTSFLGLPSFLYSFMPPTLPPSIPPSGALSLSPSLPAQGMKALREQNIVHRDLKPGNILIKKDVVTGKMKASGGWALFRVIAVVAMGWGAGGGRESH